MKNRVVDIETASNELMNRWHNFVSTDYKTFQTPEFQEAIKKLAFELVEAENASYQMEKAKTEQEQCRIIEEAGEDFLQFFYFSVACQDTLLSFERTTQHKIREEIISRMTSDFEVSTEFGQMLLYVCVKKCRFQVGEMLDQSMDLILGYLNRHAEKLWDKAKDEMALAIATNEKFSFTKKHYAKTIEVLFKYVPNGRALIYHPVAKNEIGKYLTTALENHNTYMESATSMSEWNIIQNIFGVSCEMCDFQTIASQEGMSVFEVYEAMIRFMKKFKKNYRKEWMMS